MIRVISGEKNGNQNQISYWNYLANNKQCRLFIVQWILSDFLTVHSSEWVRLFFVTFQINWFEAIRTRILECLDSILHSINVKLSQIEKKNIEQITLGLRHTAKYLKLSNYEWEKLTFAPSKRPTSTLLTVHLEHQLPWISISFESFESFESFHFDNWFCLDIYKQKCRAFV